MRQDMKAMILVLVSDIQAADLIAFELSREGYYLIRACNGQDGLRLLRTRKPDVVLIDLPERMDPDSFDVFFQLQEDGLDTSPLTFVNDSEIDLAESFKMDYIVKPFSIHELMERINCISLRSEQVQRPMIQTLGRITIDMRRAVVLKDDAPIEMSLHDYDLFTVLASQPGQVFGREKLMTSVWGYTGYLGDIRLVDVAIRRLRIKIEDDPSNPQFIMTRRGKGYFLAV